MKKIFLFISIFSLSFFLLGCQKKDDSFQSIQNINIQEIAKKEKEKYSQTYHISTNANISSNTPITNHQIENPTYLDQSASIDGNQGLNQNGVRPDVQQWIDSQPISQNDKKALLQFANALQSELDSDIQEKNAIASSLIKMNHAMQCLSSKYSTSQSNLPTLVGELQNYILNTNSRLNHYIQFNTVISTQMKTIDFHQPNENACL